MLRKEVEIILITHHILCNVLKIIEVIPMKLGDNLPLIHVELVSKQTLYFSLDIQSRYDSTDY